MDKNEINTKFILIPMDRLELNEGQLEGLPANPRDIIERKFELLKKDIQDYPEMLYLRGLMVYPISDKKYIIIGGNMRYRTTQASRSSNIAIQVGYYIYYIS